MEYLGVLRNIRTELVRANELKLKELKLKGLELILQARVADVKNLDELSDNIEKIVEEEQSS